MVMRGGRIVETGGFGELHDAEGGALKTLLGEE
jgi:hypothetical protein